MSIVLVIARMAAGGYFVWAGSSKLGRSRELWSRVMDYRVVGPRPSRLIAALLPPVEFIGGLFFAAGVYPVVATGPLILILLATDSIALAVALVRGADIDCGCGPASTPVRPRMLVRNAILALLAVGGMFAAAPTYPGGPLVVVAGLAVVAAISVSNYRALGN